LVRRAKAICDLLGSVLADGAEPAYDFAVTQERELMAPGVVQVGYPRDEFGRL